METFVLCPFRVGTLLWEAQPGQRSLTVIVKATFLLVPDGEAVPAPEQDPIGDDKYWEESALGSLFRPDDLAPLKRRVVLALVGHAYAPGGAPVPELTARLRVGDFFKTLEIKGDRLWTEGPTGLVVGEPVPFARMPLRYERAPLGPDNPVGVDADAPPSLGAAARANLERADGPRPAPVVSATRGNATPNRSSFPPPTPQPPSIAVGFGPITPTWRPRRKLLDESGLFWAYGVASASGGTGPAPAGFNFEFFNTSPRDQQIDMLRAGAVIELENLSPTHPRLTTQLPTIRPQVFRIDPRTGRSEEIILRCDTLWIDTDRGVAVLTFRGLYDVGSGDDETIGKLLIAADPQGKKLRFDRVEQMLREQSPGSLGPARPSSTTGPDTDPLALRYDTVKASRPAPTAPPAPIVAPRAKADPTQRFDWQTGFAPEESTADLPCSEEAHHDRTRDISQMPRRKAPLPFQSQGQGQRQGSSPELSDIVAFVSAPTVLAPKEIPIDLPVQAPAPPAPPPPPAIVAAPTIPTTPTPEIAAPMTPMTAMKPMMLTTPREAAPPDAIGGLGVVLAESKAPVKAPAPPADKPVAPSAPAASTPLGKDAAIEDPAPESVPIELYAAVSAALGRKGVDRGAVLRTHKLSLAGWGAIDRHWKRSLAEQAERGEKALLHAFDVAYVTAQGELHRPVGVREYARILVGLERGEVGRVLAALELQLSDLMRIQRVWSKRVAEAPELAAELAVLLEELRKG